MEFFLKRKQFRPGQFHSKCYVFGDYDYDYNWITTDYGCHKCVLQLKERVVKKAWMAFDIMVKLAIL